MLPGSRFQEARAVIGLISKIFVTLVFFSGASPLVALPANDRSEERVRATDHAG